MGVRVDAWTWSVRVFPSRSRATAACRGGHVRVNGSPAAASRQVSVGDRVQVTLPGGRMRVLEVTRPIAKRVGAPQAAECYVDHSPPPPPKEVLATLPRRDRGAGRPTKRDRRELERLRGRAVPGQ